MNKMKNNLPILTITFIERLAFYLFNGGLILYLISGDNISQEKSFSIFSVFKILIYSLPVIMGIVSDLADRKKVFKIGLIISIVGYALVPILAFNYWLLIISIVTLAIGIAIIRPNIPVFIGDNVSQTGNDKRFFRDFILMMFFVSLAPMIVNGINNSFTDKTLIIAIITSSILMLIVFLIFHFITISNYSQENSDNNIKLKDSIGLLITFFIVSIIVMILTNNISPRLAIETEDTKLTFQNINNFFSVPLTIILLIILAFKAIKIQLNTLMFMLGAATIGFALIFLSVDFKELSNFSFSPDSKILIIVLFAVVETVFFPIITLFIYRISTRYKGFVFGLYYSLVAWIGYTFSRMELNKNYLLIPIIFLIIIGVIMILKRNKIKNISA
ncbi:MAG: MFS transporter [bacterium]